MKLNDVIDIDGKLYKITYMGRSGNFEAKPVGEVVAKGSVVKEPQDDYELISELDDFCRDRLGCIACPLEKYLSCNFDDYTSEQLNEAYNIIRENEDESID